MVTIEFPIAEGYRFTVHILNNLIKMVITKLILLAFVVKGLEIG